MAKMFPEVYPGRWDMENPEFIVYQELRKLPPEFSVLYSKKFKGVLKAKEEVEIDFLIFNGKDVLICLEVKGGLIKYDGAESRWYQNGKPLERSPDRQVSAATHALIRGMEDVIGSVNVDWALCFPHCQIPEPLRELTGLPSVHVIDERKLLNINGAVNLLIAHLRNKREKPGLTANQAAALIELLNRSLGFVQKLGIKIAKNNQQLIEVTEEQFAALEDIRLNPRILINGSAGTGKTLLAQEFAKRLAREEKSVLLLFFNKAIAKKIRTAFEKGDRVQVSTFHSFARRLIETIDANWWNERTDKNEEFWNYAVPLKLLEIPERFLPKYDAIIVDEGQDFKPEWLEFLEILLKDKRQNNLCVFCDERQDIFHHWKDIPWEFRPARKVLTKNCRNTRLIVDFINSRCNCAMTCFDKSPIGCEVVERSHINEVEEQTQIVRDIRDLTERNDVKAGSIIILMNKPKETSCLKDTKKIGKYDLVSLGFDYDESINQIRYSNISVFKGLEADVVLIVDIDEESGEKLAQLYYVQGSRAKNLLYIYKRVKETTPVSSDGP